MKESKIWIENENETFMKESKIWIENENETVKDQATRLQKEIDEYEQKIKDINDIESLKKEEEECIKNLEEYDKYITDVTYNIPEEVEWEGKTYKRSSITSKIIYFISKQEVKWQYTLGLYQLCNLWKQDDKKTITYKELDSTLRVLEAPNFKGYNEWRDILMINEFMKPLHDGYTKILALQIALSQKHNAVLNQLELVTPKNN